MESYYNPDEYARQLMSDVNPEVGVSYSGTSDYKRSNMTTKSINDYTLIELQNIEPFGQKETFSQVIIVPMDELHDSGYRNMKFILLREDKIVGVVGGWCDMMLPNGVGNLGRYYDISSFMRVPYLGLSIDCLRASGCIRIMMSGLYQADDWIGSDFLFYKVEEDQ